MIDSSEILAQAPATQALSSFIAGILSSFTPCVYPLIPITLAVMGARESESKLRGFYLSLAYVFGIATTYTLLGILSAKTGALFGSLLSSPVVIAIFGVLICFLALYSLEVIELPWFSRLQSWGSRVGGKGLRGSFLMGTVSGLVAAPCVGPVLVVILSIAAASGSVTWGGLLLFLYSLGLGLPFLILGTFSTLIGRLPKSGSWLGGVKFITSVGLILVLLYLIHTRVPLPWVEFLTAKSPLFVSFGAVAFLYLARRSYLSPSHPLRLLCCVGLAILTSAFVLHPPQSRSTISTSGESPWLPTVEAALSEARERNTIAMIDLFAEWCAACKELDAKTFPDAAVRAEMGRFALARVDFTDGSDYSGLLAMKYGVPGLPCILFLRADGTEVPNSRITGFLSAEVMAEKLREITG